MAAKVTVTTKDHGYAALVAKLYGQSKTKPVVRVGVLSKDGDKAYQPKAARGANDNAGARAVTVLQVAIFNEFGTSRIPARSFIRAWFDENREVAKAKFRVLMQSVVRGDRTKEQILDLIGLWAVGQIQLRIAAGIAPANADSTIKRKGSSTPLIDTGILRASINYMIE